MTGLRGSYEFFVFRLMYAALLMSIGYWTAPSGPTYAAEDAILAKLRTERAIDVSPKSIELLEAATQLVWENLRPDDDASRHQIISYWLSIGAYNRALALRGELPKNGVEYVWTLQSVIARLSLDGRFDEALHLITVLPKDRQSVSQFEIFQHLLNRGEIERAKGLLTKIPSETSPSLKRQIENSWKNISLAIAKYDSVEAAEGYLKEVEKRLLASSLGGKTNAIYGPLSWTYCELGSYQNSVLMANKVDGTHATMRVLTSLAPCLAAAGQSALAQKVLADAEKAISALEETGPRVSEWSKTNLLRARAYLGEATSLIREADKIRDPHDKRMAMYALQGIFVEQGKYDALQEILRVGFPQAYEASWKTITAERLARDGALNESVEVASKLSDPIGRAFVYAKIALIIAGKD